MQGEVRMAAPECEADTSCGDLQLTVRDPLPSCVANVNSSQTESAAVAAEKTVKA